MEIIAIKENQKKKIFFSFLLVLGLLLFTGLASAINYTDTFGGTLTTDEGVSDRYFGNVISINLLANQSANFNKVCKVSASPAPRVVVFNFTNQAQVLGNASFGADNCANFSINITSSAQKLIVATIFNDGSGSVNHKRGAVSFPTNGTPNGKIYFYNTTYRNFNAATNTWTQDLTLGYDFNNMSVDIVNLTIVPTIAFGAATTPNGTTFILGHNVTINGTITDGTNSPMEINVYNSSGSAVLTFCLGNITIGCFSVLPPSQRLGNPSTTIEKTFNTSRIEFGTENRSLDVGTYYFNVTFSNSSGIINYTDTRVFYIYNMSAGSLSAPSNNSNVSQRVINISWTNGTITPNASSAAVKNFTLLLYNSDAATLNRTIGTYTTLNLSNLDIYALNLSVGSYWFRVNYSDNFNRTSLSEPSKFNLLTNHELQVFAREYFTNGSISAYSVNLTGVNDSSFQQVNTTTGQANLNVIRGYSYYAIVDASGYAIPNSSALINITDTINSSYTFYLFRTNSLYIFVYDETTNLLINTTAVSIFLTSDTAQFNYTTNNGTAFIFNIPVGYYEVAFSAIGYSNRSYFVTINNRTTQTLNARLLTGFSTIGTYIKNPGEEPIVGALVTIQRQNNNTWVTIAQGITDGIGFIEWQLQDGVNYLWTIDASGYALKQFELRPYAANQPYVFKLQLSTNRLFIPFNEYASYIYSPTSGLINPGTRSFNFTTASRNSSLGSASILWTAQNCNGTLTNVTGSPSGTTITQTFFLQNNTGTFSCTYSFQVDGYAAYYTTIRYYVGQYAPNNASFTNVAADFAEETPSGFKGMFGIFILVMCIIAVRIFLDGTRDPNQVLTFVGAAVVGVLSFPGIEIFPTLLGGIICLEVIFMYFASRGGGYP